MNKTYLLLIIGTLLLTGCDKTTSIKSLFNQYFLGKQEVIESKISEFEVVLFVDGTDKIHNEYAVPTVNVDYITKLVTKIKQSGQGKLWLGYIDNASQNNNIAYFEILRSPGPVQILGKKRSETTSEFEIRYKTETLKFKKDSSDFEKSDSQKMSVFLKEVQAILTLAYSEKVAKARVGSDINGAINSGSRLLSRKYFSNAKQYIILVSDGVDNIGKELLEVPENVQVILVNNSGSKRKMDTKIIELDNLPRMEEFIFSDK